MRKISAVLLMLFSVFILSGCDFFNSEETNLEPKQWVKLPDLNYMNINEVNAELTKLGMTYEVVYSEDEVEGYEGIFIMYMEHNIDDLVTTDELVKVLVYPPKEGVVELPDISGELYVDAVKILSELGISFVRVDVETDDQSLINQVIGYEGYTFGDLVDNRSAIKVEVYKITSSTGGYFFPIELEYDGPYLDESFKDIDYLDPRGGYFEVTLNYCTDGDTAKFHYPTDVYNAIESYAKSVRFLNMDTEETYGGGEEEWGKPASVYTCELLTSAESIIVQTDPGDGLLDVHGRLLGWIWVRFSGETEYQLLNYMVVRQGLAHVKYEFGGGTTISYDGMTYNDWMHVAENHAKTEKLGQWGDLLDYYWDYEKDKPNANWFN